jgi:alkaline phosphatase D
MGVTGNWDGRISRRTLLRTGGTLVAGLAFFDQSALRAGARPPFEGDPFRLGVASGDMTPDGVVLWTRLAPAELDGSGMKDETYGVRYEVAADENFTRIVRRGTVPAVPEEVHSVHAAVGGLESETTYWYRFKWGPAESPVGRTRTAPAAGSMPGEGLRFAFASCQNYTGGLYTAYADMAQQDLDLVVHLGDYIYEGPGQDRRVREHLPARELLSLSDYRTRHAQYRTDTDLQAAHAAFPWLMTWDDHEFTNNYADLDIDEPDIPLEAVAERRAAAYLAYWEHAPLARSRKPVGKDMALYRRVHWGALATFHVLDTRQYRSNQMARQCTLQRDPESGYCPEQLDPARAILGAEQREWLFEGLAGSSASWNVVANQVPFAPNDTATRPDRRTFGLDSWDGYVADRQRVLDFIAERRLGNVVAITGDSHFNSVRNVPPSFRSLDGAPVATEFIGTSISTNGDPANRQPTYGGDPKNPQILYRDNNRGYVIVVAGPQRWTSEFRVMDTVMQPESAASTLSTFVVEQGVPGAQRV